jgi:hypothetical protein
LVLLSKMFGQCLGIVLLLKTKVLAFNFQDRDLKTWTEKVVLIFDAFNCNVDNVAVLQLFENHLRCGSCLLYVLFFRRRRVRQSTFCVNSVAFY